MGRLLSYKVHLVLLLTLVVMLQFDDEVSEGLSLLFILHAGRFGNRAAGCLPDYASAGSPSSLFFVGSNLFGNLIHEILHLLMVEANATLAE